METEIRTVTRAESMEEDGAIEEMRESRRWAEITRIEEGWSTDRKYHVVDGSGRDLLVRVSPGDQMERKRFEYKCLERLSELGLLTPEPIELGTCCSGEYLYTILSWIPGEQAAEVIGGLPPDEQYRLGREAGATLAGIHLLSGSIAAESWNEHYRRKIDRIFNWYGQCSVKLEFGEQLMEFVSANVSRLADRPVRFQHGDYHLGSLIITPDARLGVIDFNRCSYGDPWEEYDRFVFTWQRSARFASGQVHGYFDDNVPDEFFSLMALYNAVNMLASIPWAVPFGEQEVEQMIRNCRLVYDSYDGFRSSIPSWYGSRPPRRKS
jgi:aminoglycoside phosphotransferase (APT) family kinase protein